MNTVGKTLVILNFLFAIAVGAFLVVDFATRTNWKDANADLKKHLEVLAADREVYAKENVESRAKIATLKGQLEEKERLIADQQIVTGTTKTDLENRIAEALNKASEADALFKKAVIDVERLKISETNMLAIIKDREQSIIKLQDTVKTFRTDALAKNALVTSTQDRNEQLLREVQDLAQKLAQAQAGPGAGGAPRGGFGNPNEPNPPKTFVKGKIMTASSDGLVTISLGTDQGVYKNNTLEVFRTNPEAKYLGMVRIVDANFQTSVGRVIVPVGATIRPQLREGDNAWSKLSE